MNNQEIVARFWADLYTREWAGSPAYFDVIRSTRTCRRLPRTSPAAPSRSWRGLRIGLEPLSKHRPRRAHGRCRRRHVVTEHVEHWEWPTGEKAALPFVSMQELRDGKIVRWWDYWDLSTLMGVGAGVVGRAHHGAAAEVGLRDET